MSWRASDVPLGDDPASRYLPWTVGMLVLLATLAMATGMILSSAGEMWRQSLSGTLTVQVPVPDPVAGAAGDIGADQDARVEAALDLLRNTPGVTAARRISDRRISELLEPWLGAQALSMNLPMPALIDVTTSPDAAIDVPALSTRLETAVPGTVVDDHAVWLRRLSNFASVAEAVSFGAMVVILLSAVATVVFTTRTGLAIHRDVVEVLHLIGAQDSYVARQFQIHTLRLASIGAAVGFALGIAAVLAIQLYGGKLGGGLLPDLSLTGLQWLALAVLPFAATLLVVVTVGITVMRDLARMM